MDQSMRYWDLRSYTAGAMYRLLADHACSNRCTSLFHFTPLLCIIYWSIQLQISHTFHLWLHFCLGRNGWREALNGSIKHEWWDKMMRWTDRIIFMWAQSVTATHMTHEVLNKTDIPINLIKHVSIIQHTHIWFHESRVPSRTGLFHLCCSRYLCYFSFISLGSWKM